jgi:uncharacterized protein (TIGR02246 family)
MISKEQVTTWVDGYLRAWRTNEADDVAAIFSEDATYYARPQQEPWRGRQQIVQEWLSRKDYQVNWTFEWSLVAIEDDRAVIEGIAVYAQAGTFANVWVITLDNDGKCIEFREWIDRVS